MATPLEGLGNEGRASNEDLMLIAQKRVDDAKKELEQAEDAGKPEAQIQSLQRTIEQYEADLVDLEKQIHGNSFIQSE